VESEQPYVQLLDSNRGFTHGENVGIPRVSDGSYRGSPFVIRTDSSLVPLNVTEACLHERQGARW